MEKECLFSIVTVVYNCSDLLEKTMLSVLQQTCPDKEYIVIDGGSTDGSVDLIHTYQKQLAYWCSERDGGIYQGMNKGIHRAKGKWIIFMNAGDVFADSGVLDKITVYAKNGDNDVIYGDILVNKGGELKLKKALEPCNKQRMYFCHQAAFVRTAIMKEHLFDVRFRMSADFYFFKRCYLSGCRFLHVHVPVAVYDRTGVSNTRK